MNGITLIPFITPAVGAAVAFFLNRGSRARRSRTAALEDMQLADRAVTLFGAKDPLTDQLQEHARATARIYLAKKAVETRRPIVIGTQIVLVSVTLTLGAISVVTGTNSLPWLLGLGAVGGIAGVVAEWQLEKAHTRRAMADIRSFGHPASASPTLEP